MTLPGGCFGESEKGSRDVFAKSEKWLGPAPTPEVSKWSSRESEVSGFAEYLMQLSAWASQASLDFRLRSWMQVGGLRQLRGRSCQQSREVGRQDC